jgi:hypothetical protein
MSQDNLLEFFRYHRLPEHLQAVSKRFADLATELVATLPSNHCLAEAA